MEAIIIPDLARMLIFGQTGVVLVLAISILIHYIYVLTRRFGMNRRLPLHVATIAFSYMIATVFITIEIGSRIGEPLTWRAPLGFFIFTTGDYALWIIRSKLTDETRFYKHEEISNK